MMKLWYVMFEGIEIDTVRAKTEERARVKAEQVGYRDVDVKAA